MVSITTLQNIDQTTGRDPSWGAFKHNVAELLPGLAELLPGVAELLPGVAELLPGVAKLLPGVAEPLWPDKSQLCRGRVPADSTALPSGFTVAFSQRAAERGTPS